MNLHDLLTGPPGAALLGLWLALGLTLELRTFARDEPLTGPARTAVNAAWALLSLGVLAQVLVRVVR